MRNARLIVPGLLLLAFGVWLVMATRSPSHAGVIARADSSEPPPPNVERAPAPRPARPRVAPAALPHNLDEALRQDPRKLDAVERTLVEQRLTFLNRLDGCLAGRIKGDHHLMSVYQMHRLDPSNWEVRSVLITGHTTNQDLDIASMDERELLHNCAQQAVEGMIRPVTPGNADAPDEVFMPIELELPIARNDYFVER